MSAFPPPPFPSEGGDAGAGPDGPAVQGNGSGSGRPVADAGSR